jgi:hypothetical protein
MDDPGRQIFSKFFFGRFVEFQRLTAEKHEKSRGPARLQVPDRRPIAALRLVARVFLLSGRDARKIKLECGKGQIFSEILHIMPTIAVGAGAPVDARDRPYRAAANVDGQERRRAETR